jgi:tetratricopeptide (TPR) repeat protein
MSYYVFSDTISYVEYLNSKSFVDESNDNLQILIQIPTSLRELIASQEILSSIAIEMKANPETKIDQLTYNINDVFKEKWQVTSRYHCAFCNYLLQIDERDTQLTISDEASGYRPTAKCIELIESTKIAYKNKEYKKSLDCILSILDEIKDNPKIKPTSDLYKLQGILYLGFYNCDLSIVDLQKAEIAFLNQIESLHNEDNIEIAQAYLLAGWSAYCSGKMDVASEHLQKALLMNRTLEEANFIMSKIYVATNFTAKALVYLGKSIASDPFYAFKAAGESEFKQHEEKINGLCVSYQDKYTLHLSYLHTEFDNIIKDKNITEVVHKRIDDALSDKSLYNLISNYKEIMKAFWICLDGEYTVEEIDEIVIKEASLFSKAVIKQIKHAYSIASRSYYLIGSRHSVDLSFALNYVDFAQGAFYIGRTQVTKGLWDFVMNSKSYVVLDMTMPAVEITWYNSVLFCNRLSLLLNLDPCYHINHDYFPTNWAKGNIEWNMEANGIRLPTEAEWDYAAKGGSKTHEYIYSGSSNPDEVAWYNKNSKRKLQKVAQLKQNELGLYDMSGNVWEWCWNAWKETEMRVLHGGSFFHSKDLCELVYRGHASPDNSGIANGLRIVQSCIDKA